MIGLVLRPGEGENKTMISSQYVPSNVETNEKEFNAEMRDLGLTKGMVPWILVDSMKALKKKRKNCRMIKIIFIQYCYCLLLKNIVKLILYNLLKYFTGTSLI